MPPLWPYMPLDMRETKVATCHYCGTRAALVLSGEKRHELACSSCGAPLHDLKMLPKEHPGRATRPKRQSTYKPRDKYEEYRSRKPKKVKKKKSFKRRAFEEIFDVIEDIFD